MMQLNLYKGRFMPKKQVNLAELNKRPLGLTIPLSNNTWSIIHSPMKLKVAKAGERCEKWGKVRKSGEKRRKLWKSLKKW